MLLQDIADYLTTGGVTTRIFQGFLPERGDPVIRLVQTGGVAPVRAMGSNPTGVSPARAVEETPAIQVTVRAATYARAELEIYHVFRRLDGTANATINGTWYRWIAARQSPFQLGRDESDRPMLGCNFLIHKAVSTATST